MPNGANQKPIGTDATGLNYVFSNLELGFHCVMCGQGTLDDPTNEYGEVMTEEYSGHLCKYIWYQTGSWFPEWIPFAIYLKSTVYSLGEMDPVEVAADAFAGPSIN